MSSLHYHRIRRLHTQFLDAADKYPLLRHAAAGNRDPRGDWPLVPLEAGDHFGVPPWEWRSLLKKQRSDPFVPLSTHWLRVAGELWNGAFFPDGPIDDELLLRLSETERTERLGIGAFHQLAKRAASFFPVEPVPVDEYERLLLQEPSARWLEIVYGLPFVVNDDSHAFLVKELPGDVFSASARAIDEYLGLRFSPPGTVASDSIPAAQRAATNVAILLAERAWHILAAVHRATPLYQELSPNLLGQLMRGWFRETAAEMAQHGPAFGEMLRKGKAGPPYELSTAWGNSCHEAVWKLLDKLVNSAWNASARCLNESSPVDWEFVEARWPVVADALATMPLFDLGKVKAELRAEGAALTPASDETPDLTETVSAVRSSDATQHDGDAPKAARSKGGRRPKWDDLRRMITEFPELDDKALAANYNRKYGAAIGSGKRERVDAKKVAEVRYNMNRKADH